MIEAAIQALLRLARVSVGMSDKLERMVSGRNRCFEIAQLGIHPAEYRELDALAATTKHMGFVLAHIAVKLLETLQAVRKGVGSSRQRLVRPRVNRHFGKRQALQRQDHWPTNSARLNGSNLCFTNQAVLVTKSGIFQT